MLYRFGHIIAIAGGIRGAGGGDLEHRIDIDTARKTPGRRIEGAKQQNITRSGEACELGRTRIVNEVVELVNVEEHDVGGHKKLVFSKLEGNFTEKPLSENPLYLLYTRLVNL